MACFVFDGVDFGEVLEVASIDIGALPETTPDMRYAPGRDGAELAGNVLAPLEIKIKARLVTDATDERDIQRKWSEAAALLRTGEPRPLSLSEGRYWLAALTGKSPLEFKTYSATAELTFVCPDPVAYGAEREVTVPSGGSATFVVGGTYPAKPTIAAQAVRDASSLVWGLRLDEGDYVHVATGNAAARPVAIDCDRRTCLVNGDVALPTLYSDWLELAPGKHTLRNDEGTGAATVAFRERWL